METNLGFPPPHIIPPSKSHTHTIIFLHGRRSNGPEFANELFEGCSTAGFTLQEHLPTYKWVFPTTKKRYSSTFQETINEWFETVSLESPERRSDLQLPGLNEATRYITALVEQESKLVPAERIILGGLSQGCATSLHALMVCQQRLGAYIGISGWLPFATPVQEILDRAAQPATHAVEFFARNLGIEQAVGSAGMAVLTTPVFLGHGTDDELVALGQGKTIRDVLVRMGMRVEWRAYGECGHWLKEPGEYDDLLAFLAESVGLRCSEDSYSEPL